MQWSITIGRIAGTAIRIHLTFLIFLLWIAGSGYVAGGWPSALSTTVFVVLIFACVVAHEFGHIFTARAFGIRTPDVTLLPIGGVASMERIPEQPLQELLIAVAGPAVNLVIAGALMLAGGIAAGDLAVAGLEQGSLLQRLATVNVALVAFNFIPAFPMDGGRVLRALLAMAIGPRRATDIAARLGQAFAFLFVLAGLFGNPMLIFVGLFIYIAAMSEQQSSAFRWFANDLTVRHGMERSVQSLAAEARLSEAVDLLLATAQRVFPVVDAGGRPVGLLERDDLLHALRGADTGASVATIMREAAAVRDDMALGEAVAAMNSRGARSQIVVDAGGAMVGLLTLDNISEMMMIHAARPDWPFRSRPN